MRSFLPILSAAALSISSSHAFLAPSIVGHGITQRSSTTSISLANKPIHKENLLDGDTAATATSSKRRSPLEKSITSSLAAACILLGAASSAFAVSGGGLDYAGLDISNQDFSNGDYHLKDFTQVLARGTTFAKSNLQGCRFSRSYLINANFEGVDARGVSFEQTSMDDANLRNINAAGAYFAASLLDVKTLEGGDFTDAQIPPKTLLQICEKEDTKGTNPTTGVDTRDSLMCL